MKQMPTSQKVIYDFQKFKQMASFYFYKKSYDKALKTIHVACGFMYTMNQIQYDADLEKIVYEIGKQICGKQSMKSANHRKVVFYDGLGNINRGLARIYIQALAYLKYEVVYISLKQSDANNESICKSIGITETCFIPKGNYTDQIKLLSKLILDKHAGKVYIYMNPDDVVATAVFSNCSDGVRRYLINMTDHAFWLGTNTFDYVINFREFGGQVCYFRRGIPKDKIGYIPYYPELSEGAEKDTITAYAEPEYVFSGGALYKTESSDHKYYRLIEYILKTYPQLSFVYLGNGNFHGFKKLCRMFPQRVIWETERNDFYSIMKNCCFYLSTYPYNGGLMTQYALLAHKIPITLCYSGIAQELTVRHEDSFWNFNSLSECKEEIDRVITDKEYRMNKEKNLSSFLISQEQFCEEIKYLIEHGHSLRHISYAAPCFKGFVELPLEQYRQMKYYRLFFRKNGAFVLRWFPLKYVLGLLSMLVEKYRMAWKPSCSYNKKPGAGK